MMGSFALVVGTVLLIPQAIGQEYQPFSSARISEVQWQSYYYSVERAHGSSVQRLPAQLVEVFKDSQTSTSWVFTQLGHPAHPAWIARRVTGEGDSASIQQVGYFAGDEAPFAEFFHSYLALNQKMELDLRHERKERSE